MHHPDGARATPGPTPSTTPTIRAYLDVALAALIELLVAAELAELEAVLAPHRATTDLTALTVALDVAGDHVRRRDDREAGGLRRLTGLSRLGRQVHTVRWTVERILELEAGTADLAFVLRSTQHSAAELAADAAGPARDATLAQYLSLVGAGVDPDQAHAVTTAVRA